jgi:hypothetical protein
MKPTEDVLEAAANDLGGQLIDITFIYNYNLPFDPADIDFTSRSAVEGAAAAIDDEVKRLFKLHRVLSEAAADLREFARRLP